MGSADQLRVLLARLRKLFLSHAQVVQSTVSIRLEKIVAATVVIRVDAAIATTDYQRYLAVAEDLNLKSIELVQEAGALFSGPGQVLQVRDQHTTPESISTAIEAEVAAWEREGNAPFPDFSADEKAQFQNSLTVDKRGG